MPEVKIGGGVALGLRLVDSEQGLEIYVVLTTCAPVDIEDRINQWYKANPEANPYDLVKWMQGKNWGLILHDESVYLHRGES